MKPISFPAALRGSLFAAAGDSDNVLRQINATIETLKTRNAARLDGLEETTTNLLNAMDGINRQIDGSAGYANISPSIIPVDSDYTKTFASFVRKGDGEQRLSELQGQGDRAAIPAALSVGTETAGGYLAPVEWDRKISQAQVATSPMRRLARVQPTSVGAFTTLWNNNMWGSGWVGETAARPITTTAALAAITFASGEVYANPAATQRILDDAAIDIGAWLIDSLRVEFNRQEGIAFLSGDGVNKPAGLLTHVPGGANENTHPGGALTVVEGDIVVDDLIDFMYGLASPYRQNSTWLMSSLTAAALSKLKDDNGSLIWRESLIVGQPATLLGRPVEIDEGMPGPTAGNLAIAFGDFNAGYLINDRYSSVRLLRDPYTNKPFVQFYATKRVGGGLLDPNAIRLLQIPA